jgi:hypothetical protein
MSKVNYACDVVLYSELESRESHEAYEVPADHIRVKRDPLDLRIARYQVDYQVALGPNRVPA